MKIVLISNLYEPYARGGAEIIVKRTADELIRQGHQVTIVTAGPWHGFDSLWPSTPPYTRGGVVSYYPLNLFFYPNDHQWPFLIRAVWHLFDIFNFHSAATIKGVLKMTKPDLVITHNLIGLGYLIPHVIRKQRIRHIHVLHDIQLAVRSGIMKKGDEGRWDVSGWPARVYQRIVKWLFGSPDIVVSPSEFLLGFYREKGYFGESKAVVVRNPLGESRPDRPSSDSVRTGRFGYIGQLVGHKGIDILRQAFDKIDDPDISLSIVGDGPMREEIEDWARSDDRVTYKGRIPNAEIPSFLSEIDTVILLTLTYENSPTVVFESLAAGVPVIVSNIGGAAEAIKDGENGFIVEPGDVDQLVSTIKKMKSVDIKQFKNAARGAVKDMAAGDYVEKLLGLI